MPGSRRRIIDVTGIAIFVLVMIVLFWPSGNDEDSADSAPDGVAEEMLSPTPEVEEEPTATPDEVAGQACVPGDSAQVLARFIVRFNDGNLDALAEFLPDASPESPTSTIFPGMDQHRLHSFTLHDSGTMAERDEILEYLGERHEADEHWRMDDFSIDRLHRSVDEGAPELDQARVVIHRQADDLPRHEIEGTAVINCEEGTILLWEFTTQEPELAMPLMIDDFLSAVGPYGTAEMRDLRMIVSTDIRSDGGALHQWDIRRIEANSAAGNYVENVTVRDENGETVIEYVYDGERWYLDQRGWREVGDVTGWGVLPLEMMVTRLEPAITARLLREHQDEIPAEGSYHIEGEFDVRDELLEAYSRLPGAGSVEAFLVLEIEDGALVRTRYRLVSPDTGLHFDVPAIRWIRMVRAARYEPGHFARPGGFDLGTVQYQTSEAMARNLTLIERLEHDESIGEVYALDWEGQEFELRVLPSRGGVDHLAHADGWDQDWHPSRMSFDDLDIVFAQTGAETFPTHAIWDDGRYRFELTVDPGQLTNPDAWSEDDIRQIAEALQPDDAP